MANLGQRKKKTALFIRCTTQEAEIIHEAASRERRTISGFILNSVLNRIGIQRRMRERLHVEAERPGTAGLRGNHSRSQPARKSA